MSSNKLKRKILRNGGVVFIRHGLQKVSQTPNRVAHRSKMDLILAFKKIFPIETMVETGTYLGEMIASCRKSFTKIISIELNKELATEAAIHFRKDSNINILNGDSGILLKEILVDNRDPVLFWLDAHYSSGITARSVEFGDTPISAELDSIFSNWVDLSVILIDDADLFNGEDGYPDLLSIESFVKRKNPNLKILVNRNIICIF